MDKNDIIEYVMHTPHNTNRAVLSGMLNEFGVSDNKQEIELSATENKVYTPAEGKVYNKVTVNVPAPPSDITTATVTIISSTQIGVFYAPYCIEAGELAPEAPAMLESSGDFELGEQTYNVVLYKGMAVANFPGVEVANVIGDAMWEEGEQTVYIMGNCTITMTA